MIPEPSRATTVLRDAFSAYVRADRCDVVGFSRADAALGNAACRWIGERLAGEARWNRYDALDGIVRMTGPPGEPGIVRILGGAWVLSRHQPGRIEAIDVLLHHDGAALERIRARLGIGRPPEQREIEGVKLRLPDDDADRVYVFEQALGA